MIDKTRLSLEIILFLVYVRCRRWVNISRIIRCFIFCGYVYETETGFYYLSSRYYDPAIGRFLNADAFTSTGQGILGNNMFAYCGNNPIIRADSTGGCYYTAGGVWAHDAWENLGGYEKKPDPGYYQGTTPAGLDVYVALDVNYATPPNAVKTVDKRDTSTFKGSPNPDIQIINSYKYTERADQCSILLLIEVYTILNPSIHKWKRTQVSLIVEWDLHNMLYERTQNQRFKDADFDNNDEHMITNLWNRIFQ